MTKPMLKSSSTSAAIRNPTGAPAPLPSPIASGMLPPITVSGAAAAIDHEDDADRAEVAGEARPQSWWVWS